MPYAGHLITVQKDMSQLLLLNSFPFSSLLSKSVLLLLVFALFFSAVAVMHGKKHNMLIVLYNFSGSNTHCPHSTHLKFNYRKRGHNFKKKLSES